MRYLLVLAALGEQLGRRLVDVGVSSWDAQVWMESWEHSVSDLGNAKPGAYTGYAYTLHNHILTHRQLLMSVEPPTDDE